MVAVTKWGGRAVLVLGLLAGAAAFARYSFAAEALFQKSAAGRVIGEGEYTRSYKNKKYQVPTVFVEYTDAAGTARTTECDRPKGLAVGAEVTVWYSPWSARNGRLTPEPATDNLPVAIRDGILVAVCAAGTVFAWGLWRGLVGDIQAVGVGQQV